ncbi:MAG: hypothetical protein ACREBZ_02830 [Thermoplasmata archaeon]
MVISLFRNERDNSPIRDGTTWGELRPRLLHFDVRDEKSGPAWSPVQYTAGATRGNAGVETISLAVMDIDDGTDPESIHRHLEELGLEHIVHSTHSSAPDHPKYRAIVPLTAPCPAKKWPMVFPRLCTLLTDGHTDPATKDAARIFYLPSVKPEGRTFAYSGHGRALAPDDTPPPAEAMSAPSPRVELGRDGKLPHGRHQEAIVSTAASLAARIAGVSEDGLIEAITGALTPLIDDLTTHAPEIREAARSALAKYAESAAGRKPDRAALESALLESRRFVSLRDSRELRIYDDACGFYVSEADTYIAGGSVLGSRKAGAPPLRPSLMRSWPPCGTARTGIERP